MIFVRWALGKTINICRAFAPIVLGFAFPLYFCIVYKVYLYHLDSQEKENVAKSTQVYKISTSASVCIPVSQESLTRTLRIALQLDVAQSLVHWA